MRSFVIITLATAISALDTVRYGAFTQTATYSIANQLGFFEAFGLNVTYEQVPNSTYAYSTVLSGGYDILTGTIDNAVNLRFNSNQSFTVLGQLDMGPDIVLASIPSMTTVEQLRGKSNIVDSPASGYAYLLRKILSSFGLLLGNGDYSFTAVGSTNIRSADLIAGSLPDGSPVYATILTYPYTSERVGLPTAQQPNILARLSEFVNPISSSAFTTRETALRNETQVGLLTRFISAVGAANMFLGNSSTQTKEDAIRAIRTQLNVSADVAALEYAAATAPGTGEVSLGGIFTVSREGLRNIISVRREFGGFGGVPGDFDFDVAIVPGVGKLIDYSIRDAAVVLLDEFLRKR
ncbi:periplasmic binding protein-like II [Xylariaceae sp. FL1272]|nr:periplasmic binding protein-like II [Xylariaceae sp. FL1272]